MDDEVGPEERVAAPGPDDGTGAVLYGMFTSFTEALGDLDGRLSAIEEAVRTVRTVPSGVDDRLAAVEASLDGLAAAVEAVRALVQSHVDDTAHSLGRRAGEAGRRLASDLGLRGRPKPPAAP